MKDLKELNTKLSQTELCQLGIKHRTDKYAHAYTRIYYELMKDFRQDSIDIMEIGIYAHF